ncbi:MAG: hypothetical protein IPJ20_26650 [Flammeovirgaceae bacterium]|nr:hypothetical protein [Flammeovirgaceae bacterium]
MADADRIGLLGISRGGMMNYLTVKGDTSTNIRALVNIGGITDLSRTIEHHAEIGDVANELIPEFEANRDMEIKKRSAIYWTHELPKIYLFYFYIVKTINMFTIVKSHNLLIACN